MQSTEIRKIFLQFFKDRGHSILPSASLVPENDPSVLFNTAGMQPLVPYLLGEKHPAGTRLVNIQKCVRTVDIDEIGDNTHATFFEMMGNWSLGDYFKAETIPWSFELLTSKDAGFGLDPRRFYVTCFEGNDDAPRDIESADIWKGIFEKAGLDPEKRIFFLPAKNNWWSPGDNGPCGPDTEMFYDVTGTLTEGLSHAEFLEADDRQDIVEIWNDVFMEYLKKDGVVVGKLDTKNVDTGSGFERVAMILQGAGSIFDTDIFKSLMEVAKTLTEDTKKQRIIADHMRTAVFMIADGVLPSNTDQGYILRRLIRRAVFSTQSRLLSDDTVQKLVAAVVSVYADVYPSIAAQQNTIQQVLAKEAEKFSQALEKGLKEFEKLAHSDISGKDAFVLFTTFGFPVEMTAELAREKEVSVDMSGFRKAFKEHQLTSKAGSEQKFKGGLAGTGEMETKYHTATHLLNAALRSVLGDHIMQKGSNITSERLRFDFSHGEKMTDEEKKAVEDFVNARIAEGLAVNCTEMPIEDARKKNAIGVFGDKYDDIVKVYTIGDMNSPASMELCGGPHVTNTSVLGHFKIQKEEASSAGVRRIKAVLE